MARKIRINVEIFTRGKIEDIEEDLPADWDSWSKEKQDAYLTEVAVLTLSEHANSGAEVVEVDE